MRQPPFNEQTVIDALQVNNRIRRKIDRDVKLFPDTRTPWKNVAGPFVILKGARKEHPDCHIPAMSRRRMRRDMAREGLQEADAIGKESGPEQGEKRRLTCCLSRKARIR
jgi:hypothetical protein